MPTNNSPQSSAAPEDFERVVQSLLTAIEAKDLKLRRHSERVAKFAFHIAEQMEIDEVAREQLRHGALLHDIGNIGIPDSILLKPAGLSQMEFDEMKLHPIIGAQIVRPLSSAEAIRPLIRSHHEKLDGSGYPDGLAGAEIPELVKILSVVDVYDSLRSERSYREAFTHENAMEILTREIERGWWDGAIVARLTDLNVSEDDFAPV
jgi:putative two-component system response regulator